MNSPTSGANKCTVDAASIWLARYSPATGNFDLARLSDVLVETTDLIRHGGETDYLIFAVCPSLEEAGQACDALIRRMIRRGARSDEYGLRLWMPDRKPPTWLHEPWAVEGVVDGNGEVAYNVGRLSELIETNATQVAMGWSSGYSIFAICPSLEEAYVACEAMRRKHGSALGQADAVVAIEDKNA